ncbi:MAG TPA: hypothetical protein VK204_11330 [Nocardioidaceae bacterium]|nr:hypothetical protein [Nocardioidaceae bacterium]
MSSCAHSQGRGVAVRRPALTGVALLLLVFSTTGCAVGGEVEGASPEPRADLAARAEVAAQNRAHPNADARKPSRHPRREGLGSGGKKAGASDVSASTADRPSRVRAARPFPPSATTRPTEWHQLASLKDPVADHGNGPAYADLTGFTVSEHDGELAASIDVAAVVPGQLADRAVQGVGIDFYRSSSDESDYQIFLDGGSRGWRAFLQTPDGFVDFPGTFSVHGRTLDVVVPWTAVGGRENAQVGVFSDWSSGVGRLSTDGTVREDLRPR